MTDYYRRSLTDRQKRALARFEKKNSLSDFEEGQVRAFRMFGDEDEKKRADRLLRRAAMETNDA